MTDWKIPPENEERDLAPLFAKRERLEGHALRVVGDGEGDPGFSLLGLIVRWLWVLQGRIVRAERWNRRAKRKAEMLGNEALRMNMVDRLGGVEALDRWEERARLALSFSSQADGSPAAQRTVRGNDEGGEGEGRNASTAQTHTQQTPQPTDTTQHPHTPQPTPSSPRRRGSPSGVPEFALARLPGRGVRRVTTRIVRAAPKHETPIPVWPCEVMPERFRKEWWKGEPSETQSKDSKFPEGRQGYPGFPTVKGYSSHAGGPGFTPGTFV